MPCCPVSSNSIRSASYDRQDLLGPVVKCYGQSEPRRLAQVAAAKCKRQCEAGDVRQRIGMCKSVDNPNDFHPYTSRVCTDIRDK